MFVKSLQLRKINISVYVLVFEWSQSVGGQQMRPKGSCGEQNWKDCVSLSGWKLA